MMRSGFGLALLVAVLGGACSGSEGGSTPTSPTTPTGGSGSQSPTNPSCVPAAPGDLRVTVTDGTRAFTWNAVSGAQDYFIQVGSASGQSNLLNTNTINRVMKNGRLYDGNTLDEIYPTARKAPSFGSEQSAPEGIPGIK